MSASRLDVQTFGQAAGPGRHRLRRWLLRRIWLPATVYRLLPWLYLGNGGACLAGAMLLPDQTWLVPYITLCGLMSWHAAYAVAMARRRSREGGHNPPPPPAR